MTRVAMLGLLLAAGCTQAPDPRGVRPDEVLLQVAATGRADAAPDEARITVGVSSTGANAQTASAANAQAMTRVTAALTRLGVKAEDMQTQTVSLARIDYGPGRGGYRAENLIQVRIRDVRQAGPAIAAATEAGGNVVSGPDLRASNPDAVLNRAYSAAYRAARTRAEAYAEAADLEVARVVAIRDGSGQAPPPYRQRYGAVEAQVATVAPPIQAGSDTYEVQVHVDFALRR